MSSAAQSRLTESKQNTHRYKCILNSYIIQPSHILLLWNINCIYSKTHHNNNKKSQRFCMILGHSQSTNPLLHYIELHHNRFPAVVSSSFNLTNPSCTALVHCVVYSDVHFRQRNAGSYVGAELCHFSAQITESTSRALAGSLVCCIYFFFAAVSHL